MKYSNDAETEDVLTTDVDAYAVADFYDVPVLKTLVAAHFEVKLNDHWDKHSFAQAVQTIYTNTPSTDRSLRDPALACIMERASDLLGSADESADEPTPLSQIMDSVPELGKDLTMRLLAERKDSNSKTQARKLVIDRLVRCECGFVWGIPDCMILDYRFPKCDIYGTFLDRCPAIV